MSNPRRIEGVPFDADIRITFEPDGVDFLISDWTAEFLLKHTETQRESMLEELCVALKEQLRNTVKVHMDFLTRQTKN